MDIKELTKLIGKKGTIKDGKRDLRYEVQIVDVKLAFGVARAKVQPVNGSGEDWVLLDSLE